VHGGNKTCIRQGGDGSKQHVVGYTHPFSTLTEVGYPVGDPVKPVQKSGTKSVVLPNVETDFDEDFTKAVLSLEFSESVDVEKLVKSLYDFDLESPEGINKLLGLLPIMDPEILVDLMEEIWPGYMAKDVDPLLMRAEIKGYLMDYLGDRKNSADV
jgi:hypothetical protein